MNIKDESQKYYSEINYTILFNSYKVFIFFKKHLFLLAILSFISILKTIYSAILHYNLTFINFVTRYTEKQ